MTQSKSEGVDQEGSTARTEAPASNPLRGQNKKIDRATLKVSLGKRVKLHDRDKMVIECLLKMATDTKLNWMQLSSGDCMISVDRDENGIISIHDYKPFRVGFSEL